MAESREAARPRLTDAMQFEPRAESSARMTWITKVNSQAMWADFLGRLDQFQATHAVPR